jgi:hypothetical protein
MPHSAIKFKNETDYSFFSKMANWGNKSGFIDLHLEPTRNKSSLWMDAAVITMFSFGFFISTDNEFITEMMHSFMLIKANQSEPILFQNSNIFDDKGFSLHHTFMYELNNSTSIKFLFNKDWNIHEFNTACEIIIRELTAFENNRINQISKLLLNSHIDSLVIVSVDVNFDTIYMVR